MPAEENENFIQTLLKLINPQSDSDEAALEAYNENPQGFLEDHGYGDITAEQVQDAVALACEDLPAEQQESLKYYNQSGGGDVYQQTNIPPPPPLQPLPGESEVEAAIKQITYVTKVTNNSYQETTNIDQSTNIDNSVDQDFDIDTDGGDVDVDQDFDNDVIQGNEGDVLNQGDESVGSIGGVAAGDDIEDSNIAIGDGNTQATDGGQAASGGGVNIGGDNEGGIATGAGAVATGEDGDIDAPVVTGTVTGVITDDGDVDIDGTFNTGEIGGDVINAEDSTVLAGGSSNSGIVANAGDVEVDESVVGQNTNAVGNNEDGVFGSGSGDVQVIEDNEGDVAVLEDSDGSAVAQDESEVEFEEVQVEEGAGDAEQFVADDIEIEDNQFGDDVEG